MITTELTLYGRVPSKKNNKRILKNKKTGKMFIMSSKSHEDWHVNATKSVLSQNIKTFISPVEVEICITFGDRRKSDLSNKVESIMDLLVDCRVLQDDNHECVPRITMQSNGYIKNNWITTIKITTR